MILPNHNLFKLAEVKPVNQRDVYFILGGEKNAHFVLIKHIFDFIEIFKNHLLEK